MFMVLECHLSVRTTPQAAHVPAQAENVPLLSPVITANDSDLSLLSFAFSANIYVSRRADNCKQYLPTKKQQLIAESSNMQPPSRATNQGINARAAMGRGGGNDSTLVLIAAEKGSGDEAKKIMSNK